VARFEALFGEALAALLHRAVDEGLEDALKFGKLELVVETHRLARGVRAQELDLDRLRRSTRR
jgi:hypothetical protein